MQPIEKLKYLAESVGLIDSDIANYVIKNINFKVWTAATSPNTHHYGTGGLIQHTLEVVELCLKNNQYFLELGKEVNAQKLFLAALYHDIGKIYDYEIVNRAEDIWQATRHKHLIHHISRSALIWNDQKLIHNYPDSQDEILHAILAHHGQKAWGSPVEPQTRMAWILHLSDSMSARVDDCVKR